MEEGEGGSTVNEDIDPDTDFSYIDEKLQDVLGPYQKDFQGCVVSVDQLGSKFGGYGSFLPTYKRSTEVAPCQKTFERNQTVQTSMSQKVIVQDLKKPAPSVRLGSVGQQTPSSCNTRVPSGGASVPRASSLLSAKASGEESLKEGHLSTSSDNPTNKKPLKFRIKMGAEYLTKASRIKSDLGLKSSPNLSTKNSHDEGSGVLLPISQVAKSDSPSEILQEMTRFPVPGGLISPLHASLLKLTRQETENKMNDNQAVLTARKFPSAPSENKLVKKSGLNKQKTQSINSCFMENTLMDGRMNSGNYRTNKTSTSRKEIQFSEDKKKPKCMARGEKMMDSSVRGFGGQSASCSVSKSKHKLEIDASNGRENQLDYPNASSDIPEFSGDKYSEMCSSERKQKSFVNKSREKCSANKSNEEATVIPPPKDTTCTGQHNLENGLAPHAIPFIASEELDTWAQCDRCDEWRLLPPYVAQDKLPKKWVCSMQSWLPNLNHCGISQNETTNAIIEKFQIPKTKAYNHPEFSINKPVPDVSHLDLSNQKKRSTSGTVSKGGCQALDQSSSYIKSDLCISLERKSMKRPLSNNSIEKSGSYKQVASCISDQKYVPEKKQKPISGGVGVVKQTNLKKGRIKIQTMPGCGSCGTKSYEELNRPLKKRKLMDLKNNHEKSDQEVLLRRENKMIQEKERSAKSSRTDSKELITKESNDRAGKSSIKQPGHGSAAKGPETKKLSVLEEAAKLRKGADNLKSSRVKSEYKETSFKAALELLHKASLIEAIHGEEMNHMDEYRSAARLFEFCAREYEIQKEIAAAALAYKCMEVAYMRMVYCKTLSTMSEWNELQTTLQMILTGESPSSSLSDADNLNHQGTVDRLVLTKGALSHKAGNHTLEALNPSKLTPLLDFTQIVNQAMESSRNSQTAFERASVALEAAQNKDCIISIKRALDFDFHDIETLITLVKAAMDAVSHSGRGGSQD